MVEEILGRVSPETMDLHEGQYDGISGEQALINELFGNFDQEMSEFAQNERMAELSRRLTVHIDYRMKQTRFTDNRP
jgi:hypothetical protein